MIALIPPSTPVIVMIILLCTEWIKINIPPTIGTTAGAEEFDTPPTDGESTNLKQSLIFIL